MGCCDPTKGFVQGTAVPLCICSSRTLPCHNRCLSHCYNTGHTAEIFSCAELPLSLKELQCGRLPNANVLLPLLYLQRLDILSCRSTAAELARLSALTALTHISLCYADSLTMNHEFHSSYGDAEVTPEAASAAWPALASQLRELHIVDYRDGGDENDLPFGLSAAAVAALGSLSALTGLSLMYLHCPEVQPEQLAAALQRCTGLQQLELGALELQWRTVEGLTGDEEVDAPLTDVARAEGMRVVAKAIASLPCLQQLSLSNLPVDMHAAAQLAAAAAGTQLTHLALQVCSLSDCSLSALALGLTNLQSLKVAYNDVGDSALPALAKLPLQRLQLDGCLFTTAAKDLFLPAGWREL
jgi:hypothetical protein